MDIHSKLERDEVDVLPVIPSLRCSGVIGFPNTSIGFSGVSFAAALEA